MSAADRCAPQPVPAPWAWLGCVGRDLLGRRGLVPTLVGWVVAVLLAGMAFAVGVVVLLPLAAAMIVLAVVAFRSPGRPAAVAAMVVSLVAGLVAFGYGWWALGVSIDAADAGGQAPAAAGWVGTALITGVLSAAAFLVAAVVAVRRGTRTAPRG